MEITKGTSQEIAKASAQANPANARELKAQDVEYPPMDLPFLKLAVTELPGYYMYWHLGKNVPRALRSGYVFVEKDEVEVFEAGVANDRGGDGSTDLGSRISVSAGDSGDEKREEERLYLMKIPLSVHEKHMDMKTARNEEIAVQIRSGQLGPDGSDKSERYMKEGQKLFYPKGKRK